MSRKTNWFTGVQSHTYVNRKYFLWLFKLIVLPYSQTNFWLKVCEITTFIFNTGRQHSVGECNGIWNYPHFPTSVCTEDSASFLITFSRYEKMKQIWWPKFTIFLLEVNRKKKSFMFKVHSRNIKDSVVDTYSVCCQLLASFILSLDLMLSTVIYH